LYKGPEQAGKHTISVIDPSNFKFSDHLKSLTSQEVPKLHRISHDKLERIDALYKEIKIYTPKNSEILRTGASQSRDCADIAVKLAFNLISMPHINLELTPGGVKLHETVKRVSNKYRYR
jgi:hypothetical protein